MTNFFQRSLKCAAAIGILAAGPAAADVAEGLAALQSKDYVAAAKAFSEANEAGDADGGFYIGRMQELGLGTAANPAKAAKIYEAAGEAGSALATNRLGLMYMSGSGVIQDYAEARRLVCEAAEAGLDNGQFNCGVLLVDERAGDVDRAEAVAWYGKAADQGHIGASNLYAIALMNGDNVEKDLEKARGLFEATGSQGNPLGLFYLGQISEQGLGVEADPVTAHFYYNVAAASGHPQAAAARARVERSLSPAEVRDAQAKARAWSPETPAQE